MTLTAARGRARQARKSRQARQATGWRPPATAYGLGLAAAGVAAAWTVHRLFPAVPLLTAAVVLGIVAAHLPGARGLVRGVCRAGLSFAGKRLMRLGIVLLGLKLSLDDVLGLGWATVAMVLGVVAATFCGTWWLGRRMGLPGDQPLLIATGYSICGASAIGAVSEVSDSDERDVATSVALVTLCGTLAIAVLPLLQHPLGLDDAAFGRWVGASVHDVGQVVATAQTAGPAALGDAVLVKLVRVALLAPLVAALATAVRVRARGARATGTEADGSEAEGTRATEPRAEGARATEPRAVGARAVGARAEGATRRRPPLVPLFVLGFLAMTALRSTGVLATAALDAAATAQELLLAAALFGLGSAVHLPSLSRTGARVAALGLCAWVVIAGASYGGVLLTT
ncbi:MULTISPECIES: YeiH family protein [Streptomyces]|uniref:Integral membrane protein (TIGR00698 family) n=1 Tax=Streptomyces demainii TaxID=588122 RepID=A0ABT9KMN8_9ACTN|nr:putative integral membrane protein (TIGR00698 family) [Streptomyces demainii]